MERNERGPTATKKNKTKQKTGPKLKKKEKKKNRMETRGPKISISTGGTLSRTGRGKRRSWQRFSRPSLVI